MNALPRTALCLALSLATLAAVHSTAPAADPKPADPKPPALTNAAAERYGTAVSLTLAKDGGKDKRSTVADTFDNNAHSRCVVWGLPYTFKIDLPGKLNVDSIGLAQSDYENDLAPKDVKIELDDGTVLKHQMTLTRKKSPIPWQKVAINKHAQKITITVESVYPNNGKTNYGGMGDIAVWTGDDLDAQMQTPGYDAKAPTFVNAPPAAATTPAKVNLPPRAKPGEHPCIFVTKDELAALKQKLQSTDKGKEALSTTLKIADGILERKVVFPDPKGPLAQTKARGDEPAKAHDALAMGAGTLGMAYALSGDAKYANRAAEILKGYAERYESYPEHKGVNGSDTGKIMAQRLSEAMWLIPLISSYDFIYESGALTADDKAKIEKDLIRAAVQFIRRNTVAGEVKTRNSKQPNWRTEGPTGPKGKGAGNWVNYYAAATVMAGATMGDKDLVDLGAAEYRGLLHAGIGEDGLWAEGAFGYQLFALSAMIPGMEAAARQGIDLWSYDNSRVKMLLDSSLRYAYPDASAPGINDSGRVKMGGWSTMSFDYGYLRFGDERYAPIVNNSNRQLHISTSIYFPAQIFETLKEPEAISYPSMVFSRVGYAVLRDDSRYNLLKYGGHGGVHGHYDKLNFILFDGDELGGEPRFHAYEDPLHGQWTIQTVAHNTMTVDQRRQSPSNGQLVTFEDAGSLKVMRGQVADAYPGVLLDRTIVVTDGAVLDLFQGSSNRPHTWDRTLRFGGKPQENDALAKTLTPLGDGHGYQHLKVSARTPATDGWHGTWETKPGTLHAWVAAQPNQEVIRAIGPDNDQVALVRQQGNSANFAMVYALDKYKTEVKSSTLAYDETAGVSTLNVVTGNSTLTVLVAGKPGAWESAKWKSDARVLVVEQKADQASVLVTGGTFADGPAGTLKSEKPGNHLATGPASKLQITRTWSPQ